jgi:hypothetical protein
MKVSFFSAFFPEERRGLGPNHFLPYAVIVLICK